MSNHTARGVSPAAAAARAATGIFSPTSRRAAELGPSPTALGCRQAQPVSKVDHNPGLSCLCKTASRRPHSSAALVLPNPSRGGVRPGPAPAQVALYLPALVIIISVPISWKRFQSSAPCRSTRGTCGEGSGVPGRARGGAGDPFGDPPGDASGEAPCRKPSSQPAGQQRAKRGKGEGSPESKLDGRWGARPRGRLGDEKDRKERERSRAFGFL